MLQRIDLASGVITDITRYGAKNRWIDGDGIRFYAGDVQKIGGWVQYLPSSLSVPATDPEGTASLYIKSMRIWLALTNIVYTSMATNKYLYIASSAEVSELTPLDNSTGYLNGVELSVTNTSAVVNIHFTTHGFSNGDKIVIEGAQDTGGITEAELNGLQTITVVDADNFTYVSTGTATSTTAGGAGWYFAAGPRVVPGYTYGTGTTGGWGSGPWGSGVWGGDSSDTDTATYQYNWSQDNFGANLVVCPRGLGIFYYDASAPNDRPKPLRYLQAQESVSLDAPESVLYCIMSDRDRHLIALGTNDTGTDIFDPMLVRWASQESLIDWTPLATNTAGSLRLTDGTSIICAARTRQEILIWTDTALYSMQFIGPPEVFGIRQIASNLSIAGPDAVAIVDDVAYWMGKNAVYRYSGRVDPLRIDVRDKVFNEVNPSALYNITAGVNKDFDEVWFFYPTTSSVENNRYVAYNYKDDVWYYGSWGRSAWTYSPIGGGAIGASANVPVVHEIGTDDCTTSTPAAITSYAVTGEFDITTPELGAGDRFMLIRRLLPDLKFVGSSATGGSATITFAVRNTPGSYYGVGSSMSGTIDITNTGDVVFPPSDYQTVTADVDQFTEQLYVRMRGRQAAMKFECTQIGLHWEMGVMRVDIKPDGRR